jgi:hypothetical protein
MSKPLKNDDEATPDWVEQLLQAHHAVATGPVETEMRSQDFRARCLAAAVSGIEVSKMRRQRYRLAGVPGSLRDHFENLARLAGVKLGGVFKVLGIIRADFPDARSARGLARLARQLELPCEEVMLRLRCGFAELAGAPLLDGWLGMPQPARARRTAVRSSDIQRLSQHLRGREADYSPSRRSELRAALNAVAEVYGQDVI